MKRWLWPVWLLLLLLPTPVRAQGPVRIVVDPGDTPLLVSGWLGEENAFIGNLRLTAEGGDVAEFTFLPSDLKLEGSDVVVGRQHVQLVGDPNLTAGVPKDLQVTISGLQQPGTYQGQIELRVRQDPSARLVVPLTVVAKARPVLTPLEGTVTVRLRLVRCEAGLDCFLAHLFLPDSAFLDSWRLQFENATGASVKVLAAEVVVVGEKTGYQLTGTALGLPQFPQVLPANQVGIVPLVLNRAHMPPDHYTGAIYLSLEGKSERLTVPVDLSVRTGPLWLLVLLLAGIVLGRIFKYMQERGYPQSEAMMSVRRLANRVRAAPPADRQIVQAMFAAVQRNAYRGRTEAIAAEVAAIESRLEVLAQVRAVEERLANRGTEEQRREVLALIGRVRDCLMLQKDEEARKALDGLPDKIAALSSQMMGEELVDPAIEAARAGQAAAARLPQAATAQGKPRWQERFQDALASLTGLSEQVRAEATFWLVRPLLYLVLLLGLLALGVGSLYVDNGLTFGAAPFNDYFALVLWGLSADVASRSLSNLRGGGGG